MAVLHYSNQRLGSVSADQPDMHRSFLWIVAAIVLCAITFIGVIGAAAEDRQFDKAMLSYESKLTEQAIAMAAQGKGDDYVVGRRWWRPDVIDDAEPEQKRWLPNILRRPVKDRLYYRIYHLSGACLCFVIVMFIGGRVVKGWWV